MTTILSGYKTYAIGLLGILVIACAALGFITIEAAEAILAALGFTGLLTLRAAVAKVQQEL